MVIRAKLNEALMKVVDYLIVLLMTTLVILITFQVVNRFILHIPAAWTEEMGRYNFVWLSLLAAVRALKDRAHLSVDILTMNLKGKSKITVDIVADLMTLIFCIILMVTGYQYTVANIGNYCEFGKFPLYIIYSVIPLSGLLLCLVSLEQIYSGTRELLGHNPGAKIDNII